jgi:anti-sigma regulatory factor (Ser/Thr protein kinase)
MDIHGGDSVFEVVLRDYGQKCDPKKLKGRELEDIKPGGLGLFFIRQAFDEVIFDPAIEVGTRLVLRKKK